MRIRSTPKRIFHMSQDLHHWWNYFFWRKVFSKRFALLYFFQWKSSNLIYMLNPKYNINDLLRRDVSIIYRTRFIIHSLWLIFFKFSLFFSWKKQTFLFWYLRNKNLMNNIKYECRKLIKDTCPQVGFWDFKGMHMEISMHKIWELEVLRKEFFICLKIYIIDETIFFDGLTIVTLVNVISVRDKYAHLGTNFLTACIWV
jgi:hypothetical protein